MGYGMMNFCGNFYSTEILSLSEMKYSDTWHGTYKYQYIPRKIKQLVPVPIVITNEQISGFRNCCVAFNCKFHDVLVTQEQVSAINSLIMMFGGQKFNIGDKFTKNQINSFISFCPLFGVITVK